MHKISTQVVCVNGQGAPQHQKHDQIGKSLFALSYILCVCCAGYQVCSAWKLPTQVLLIFKMYTLTVCKCHILYSIELRRPSTQNKDDFLVITKQGLERGTRLSLQLGVEYCRHIETPKAGDWA